MTPEDLRSEIPATESVAYFNTGASGPSPRRVVEAVCDFQSYHEFETPGGEGMYEAGWRRLDEVRETIASFLSATPAEITFTGSTAEGINRIASSIDWAAGDRVVRTDLEHPAGVLPWRRLADTHGVHVEVVESTDGRTDLKKWATAVEDARLVCTSSLAWTLGTHQAIDEIVDIAHAAGALVLVDAVQSIGQHPVDVSAWGADFVAGSGHKWPLGPWGSGLLYVDDAARDRLQPTRIGGRSVEDGHSSGYEYKESAALFEVSTGPIAIYCGLEAAIETVQAVGFGAIQTRVKRLTDRLKAGIPDGRLRSPSGYESGLVAFDVADPESFVERCRSDDIVIRSIPALDCVRVSVHAFNTAEEVDALLDLI